MINIKKLTQINQIKVQELIKRANIDDDADADNNQIELIDSIIKKAKELDTIELQIADKYNELTNQMEYMQKYQDYADAEFIAQYINDYKYVKDKLKKHKWLNQDELEISNATSEGLDMMITDLYYIDGEIDTIIEYGEPVIDEIEEMLLDGYEPGE